MKAASLSEWLKSHELERFIEVFEENEVDLSTLRLLTESDLQELGLPFGPRKRILNLLNQEKALEKSEAARAGTPVGERRQLTVLFCDMVGFTKLAYKLDPSKKPKHIDLMFPVFAVAAPAVQEDERRVALAAYFADDVQSVVGTDGFPDRLDVRLPCDGRRRQQAKAGD